MAVPGTGGAGAGAAAEGGGGCCGAATGAGALIAGVVLQAIDFPTDLAQRGGTSAVLPEHLVRLLGLFYGPGAALLTLGAVLVTLLYRLDSKAHAAIMGELIQRRRDPPDVHALGL